MASTKTIDVTVVGSILTDLICYADRLPRPGETIAGTDFQSGYGGKGANQCIGAQCLGVKTAMIGKVGKDVFGREFYDHFVKEGVNVDGVTFEDDVPTGVASIMIDNQGDNTILYVDGATKLVSPDYVLQVGHALIASSKIMVGQLEVPVESTLMAFQLAKQYGATTVLNAAPGRSNVPEQLFQLTDILVVNESEAEIISGLEKVTATAGATEAVEKMKKLGCTNVIITLGGDGAILWNDSTKSFLQLQAPKVKVIDTVGAGDCFVGTLTACLSSGEELTSAFKQAISNASDCVQRKGTQRSFPDKLVRPNN